jgi:hypothetical protein
MVIGADFVRVGAEFDCQDMRRLHKPWGLAQLGLAILRDGIDLRCDADGVSTCTFADRGATGAGTLRRSSVFSSRSSGRWGSFAIFGCASEASVASQLAPDERSFAASRRIANIPFII